MKKKNMILTVVLSIVLVLMITIGASYAYFTAKMLGEDSTTITVKGGKMLITYNGGDTININNILPDDNPAAIKTFTITGFNNTEIDMGYKISLVVESNTFTDVALKYKLISTNTDNNGNVAKNITDLTDIPTGTNTITLGYGDFEVPTDENKTHTYNLELYFPNQNYDQNIEQQKQIKAHVTVENFDYYSLPYDETKGVNRPVLFAGMTPVKWDENLNEIETTKKDHEWYDYTNQKWANAKTADGSYWVWIPRYAYRITSGYHTSTAGTIDIKFLKEDTIENEAGTAVETTGYIAGTKDTSTFHFLHPAFDVVGSKLGFWVAKFEPSGTSSNINILPNVVSLKNIKIGNAFDAVLNMKTNPVYGWEPEEVDPHMLTNLEWGAVAYLSKSGYGANAEVWINNNSNYITGCGGDSVSSLQTTSCNAYNTGIGAKASTTHNIYGVYDMSGGAFEYVPAYVNTGTASITDYGQSILNANIKYKNIYAMGADDKWTIIYAANKNIYGDAIYETSSNGNYQTSNSWYGDRSEIPHSSIPWFGRGSGFSYGSGAGLFAFKYASGINSSSFSFRPAVRSAS